MSFTEAKKAFHENQTDHLDSQQDSALWNLSLGLEELTKALELEAMQARQHRAQIDRRLQAIESSLRQR